MLAIERRQAILEKLRVKGSVIVSDLAKEFSVSEETIRRDLTHMANEGLIEKTYGGAYIVEGMHRVLPVDVRAHAWVEGKKKIAAYAASLIQNGDTIFLDCSTTVLYIAERILSRRNVVAITNSIRTAEMLAKSDGIRVVLTGGTLRQSTLSTVGRIAESEIAQYFADKAIVSCDGLHLTRGVTDSNEEEAEIRRTMVQQAANVILVADATKFDRTSFVYMGGFEQFDCLVTDRDLDERWLSVLGERGVSCHCETASDTVAKTD